MAASINPNLAVYLPDESVAAESLELVERKRNQSGFVEQTVPQVNNADKNRPSKEKPYSKGPYSYSKRSVYSLDYFKPKVKNLYNGIERKVREVFSKIRSVYQSGFGVLRMTKDYKGKNAATSKVTSLEDYRAAINQRQYKTHINVSDESLEEKLAA